MTMVYKDGDDDDEVYEGDGDDDDGEAYEGDDDDDNDSIQSLFWNKKWRRLGTSSPMTTVAMEIRMPRGPTK